MKLRIIINGNVQMIGYRAFVKLTGRLSKLKGVIRNLEDGSVEIYSDGDEKTLRKFYEDITNETEIEGMVINEKSFISEKDREYHREREPKDFKLLDIDYGRELTQTEKEQMERNEIAIFYFNKLRKENKHGFNNMLEKQDQTIQKLESMDNKLDGVGNKIDGVGSKLDGVRSDLKELNSKQDKNIQKLDEFNNATKQRFDTVEEKYGKVSEKLGKLESIDKHLKELVDILRAFKPK